MQLTRQAKLLQNGEQLAQRSPFEASPDQG